MHVGVMMQVSQNETAGKRNTHFRMSTTSCIVKKVLHLKRAIEKMKIV